MIVKLKRYVYYSFKGIDCMISSDGKELGFFKNDNDRRPSQATYINKIKAEKLHTIYSKSRKEFFKERDELWIKKFDKYSCIKNNKWYLDWKKSIKK